MRLAQEPLVSAAFVVHSPKKDKTKPQIWTFNDTFVVAMLQIMEEYHITQLASRQDDDEAPIQQQHICPDLTYNSCNIMIKTAATHFGLANAKFTTHGAHIIPAPTQLAKTKYIGL